MILACLLALAGCQNEDSVDNGGSQSSQVIMTASISTSSRTYLDSESMHTVWSEGDQIYVSSADGKVTGTLTLTSEPGRTSGTFTGYVLGDPDKLDYSVFPVPENGETIDLSQVTGGDNLDAPMIGQINNYHVPFQNTCGILRLNLQDVNGKSFTISAKNASSGADAKLLTTATVKVENGVAKFEYTSSSDGTIALNNAVSGFMYVPYFIDQDVNVCVDGIEVAEVKQDDFIGKLKIDNVKTLIYSTTANGLIAPTDVQIDATQNVENQTLVLNISSKGSGNPEQGSDTSTPTAEIHEYVNIPSITEALTGDGDTDIEVTSVVVELPKITVTSAPKSVVSFEEIPQGVTVSIQEEAQSASGNTESVEELTVILPSGTTKEETKQAVEINMPNTTVTVKLADGNVLLINEMTATTADHTLIIGKNIEIGTLSILKGGIKIEGKVNKIIRKEGNTNTVTEILIGSGATVENLLELMRDSNFSVHFENEADGPEGFVEESDGTYTIYGAKGWDEFVAMVNGGETFIGKTVKLGGDIDLKNKLQKPIGVQEELDWDKICFAGTLDGQNYSIKNLKIDNTVGQFTGLFAFVQGATFKNLRLASGEVQGTGITSPMFVGAFLGYGMGVTIINCHNEGCKVINIYKENNGKAGGIVGSLSYTEDNRCSYIIACTNSAEVSGAYCPSGIIGGDWDGYVSIVACANTGKISYSGTQLDDSGIYAAGISGALGGSNNWMYGCFTDCEVVPGQNHSALVSDAGSSYVNFHYSYSANTSMSLLAAWGNPFTSDNNTIDYSSYNDAVDNLNKGIEMYNQTATVLCTYQFVKGDKPALINCEPNS